MECAPSLLSSRRCWPDDTRSGAQALRADDRSYFGSASLEREAWQNLERSNHALKALQAPPDVRFQQAEQLYGECLRHHGYLHLQAARNADDARLANTQGEVAGTSRRLPSRHYVMRPRRLLDRAACRPA